MDQGRTVVTGATGHLGNVLVRALVARGLPVRAVLQAGDDALPLRGLPVEQVTADMGRPDHLEAAFAGADTVFHFAGIVSITRGDEARMQAVNVEGTRHVLAAVVRAGVRRLVHAGSVHALPDPVGDVLDEASGFDPARVVGPYAKTKARACLEVQAAARAGRVDAVLVLPTAVVGPYDFRQSELGELIARLGDGRLPFLVQGAHDFVDVRDVARGTLAAAAHGRTGEAYLLGGERLDTRRLAGLIAHASGQRVPRTLPLWLARLVATPAPVYERLTGRRALVTPYALHALAAPFTVSHAKASRELGYAPGSAEQAVLDALRWQHADAGSPRNRGLGTPGPGRRGWAEAAA